MAENPSNQVSDTIGSETLKDITNIIKKANINSGELKVDGSVSDSNSGGIKVNGSINDSNAEVDSENTTVSSQFKVASANLPEKTGIWTKLKNALFYEIRVELTPYQQKIEREINDFLHQEITWKSLKKVALSEVPITFRGKRIF